eukprot:6400159-Prymnesium_polylepis.1
MQRGEGRGPDRTRPNTRATQRASSLGSITPRGGVKFCTAITFLWLGGESFRRFGDLWACFREA